MRGGFNGQYDHAIDDKGRVSIPARFRELLEHGADQDGQPPIVYITKHKLFKHKCLALYASSQWEQKVGRMQQKIGFDPDFDNFQTWLLGNTGEIELDKQGRILIPTNLREYAEIQRDVTFRGALDHFVLFDRQAHAGWERVAEQTVTDPRFLKKLGV